MKSELKMKNKTNKLERLNQQIKIHFRDKKEAKFVYF